jgi:hypothetical protein
MIPFALSASENAAIEESEAKSRVIRDKEKVEEFFTQTKMNVIKR